MRRMSRILVQNINRISYLLAFERIILHEL